MFRSPVVVAARPVLRRCAFILAALALGLIAAPASAQRASRDQGDWPCRQVKVPELSIAQIWSGPAADVAGAKWRSDAALAQLVASVAARRTPLETAEKLVKDYAAALGEKKREKLTLLFAGAFETLDAERREVIAGLDRYGRKQKEMAERLREEMQNLHNAQDKGADAAAMQQASEALQWDLRIFEERSKAVGFVCETPALIEQRLGALARVIEAAMA
jgi:hypothetical protein